MTGGTTAGGHRKAPRDGQHWLVVSYYANELGRAASHHLDDRLAGIEAAGVRLTVLSSLNGPGYRNTPQLRICSPSPTGVYEELRQFVRRRRRGAIEKQAWHWVLLPLSLWLVPLYPLDKLLNWHEKRAAWRYSAFLRAAVWVMRYRPEVIYTTGGPASAHQAGSWLSRLCGARLVCEFQDPLHFQYPESHPRRHAYHQLLEARLARRAHRLVYLCEGAARSARRRLPGAPVIANLSGAPVIEPLTGAPAAPDAPRRTARGGTTGSAQCADQRVLAHVGGLGGSRNLQGLLLAADRLAARDPRFASRFRLCLAGSLRSEVRESVAAAQVSDSVDVLGRISRARAETLMRRADILLLVQHRDPVSRETIPSKAFEYLLAGRPILALVYDNPELERLLRDHGHTVVCQARADHGQALEQALQDLYFKPLPRPRAAALTASRSAQRLVDAVNGPLPEHGRTVTPAAALQADPR